MTDLSAGGGGSGMMPGMMGGMGMGGMPVGSGPPNVSNGMITSPPKKVKKNDSISNEYTDEIMFIMIQIV